MVATPHAAANKGQLPSTQAPFTSVAAMLATERRPLAIKVHTTTDIPLIPMPGISGSTHTAPTPAIAQHAASPVHPAVANAAQEIVAQAQLLRNGQTTEMRLRLRPPDLGEVGVTVQRAMNGGLTVHLVPATREAAAALGANLHTLRATLEAQSNGQGANVTLGQHDASGSSQHQRREAFTGESAPMPDAPAAPPTSRASTTQPRTTSTIDYDA